MHDGQLVRGVLVLLLDLGRHPPAAGAAELQLAGAVPGLGRVIEVRGVGLDTELSVEPITSVVVLVLVRGSEVGEALPEHGEAHVVVPSVRVALVRSSDVIPPSVRFPWNACM